MGSSMAKRTTTRGRLIRVSSENYDDLLGLRDDLGLGSINDVVGEGVQEIKKKKRKSGGGFTAGFIGGL